MIEQTENNFEAYLLCLGNFLKFPTVLNRPDQIETAMRWCQDSLTRHLRDYRIYRDQKRNLIACPEKIDLGHDIIYLIAHMDTVRIGSIGMGGTIFPFSLYEDESQMVERGVSDCKAGVAFELFLSKLVNTQHIALSNLISTIIFLQQTFLLLRKFLNI